MPSPSTAPVPPSRRERVRFGLYAAHLWTTWALGISNSFLGLMIVAAPWLGRPRLPAGPAARRALALGALYLALLVAAIAASRNVVTSLRSLSEIASFATFFAALFWLRGERPLRRLVDVLILVGAGLALQGLAQVMLGYGDLDRRIRGPFSHYMTFAGTLLLLDLLLVARMLVRCERLPGHGPTAWLDRPWLAWAALLAINLALIVSLTRSAWLALAVGLALAAAVAKPRLLVAAVPIAVVFLVLAPVPVVHRLLSIASLGDESNYDRIVMAEAGLRMIGERPLYGVGPDLVRHYWGVYRDPSTPRLVTPHLHDAYIELAAERGLPELATFLALLASAAWAAWRGFRREHAAGDGTADLHLGVLVALVGFSIAALFENNWGDTEVQRLVLFLLAMPFCLEAERAAAPPPPADAAP